MHKLRDSVGMALLLLIAAALRLIGIINISPPGLEHDEVANWLIDRAILDGQHAVYFTDAYGHEAGFHYVQAAFVALLGDNSLALRLPAALFGVLGVAVAYALAKELFGKRVAVISAVLLTPLFFPIFYSRLALRAISLPVVSGLAGLFFIRSGQWGVGSEKLSSSFTPHPSSFFLSAVLAGLSLYTYMAARVMPIFFTLFILYLLIWHRDWAKEQWQSLVGFALTFFLVSLPLILFLRNLPDGETRIGEIDQPLRALFAGDLTLIWQNFVQILQWPLFVADPLWRQGVPTMPLFGIFLGIIFFAAFLLNLPKLREPRFAFIYLWLGCAIIPSVLTVDAPSSIRMINVLPVIALLPAISINNLRKFSPKKAALSTDLRLIGLTLFIFVFNLGRSTNAVFRVWPNNVEEVQFVWQKALKETADYLNATPNATNVALAGWSPESLDAPTMTLTITRDDLSLRHFNPANSLILPSGNAQLIRPTILPLNETLERKVSEIGIVSNVNDNFVVYNLDNVALSSGTNRWTFGDVIELVGWEKTAANQYTLTWHILNRPAQPYNFFMHVIDADGNLTAQDDRSWTEAPTQYWHKGDFLLQTFTVDTRMADHLRVGVYEPNLGRRLETTDSQTFAILTP